MESSTGWKTNKSRKSALIKHFGGSCQRCGYNRCERALHFHHVDSSEKQEWSNNRYKTSINEVEAHPERFMLVCSNCHAEIHDEEAKSAYTLRHCQFCGKEFKSQPHRAKSGRGKYCSKACAYADWTRISQTPEAIEKRIMKHTVKTDTCWIWQSGMMNGKYPSFSIKGNGSKRTTISIPRFLYEHHVAKLPKTKQVRRTCNEPRCVNPAHLRST